MAEFETIAARMAELFELDPSELTPNARLAEDLDLDSIDAIDMLKVIEEATGARIGQEVLRELKTVADVAALFDRAQRGD